MMKKNEELANYLLSLSDDDGYSEIDDKKSVCGRNQVIDDSGDDVCSNETDSMWPPEFSIVDENCDNCCPTNFNYAEILGPKHAPLLNADPIDYLRDLQGAWTKLCGCEKTFGYRKLSHKGVPCCHGQLFHKC
jgi:hypothetical protein